MNFTDFITVSGKRVRKEHYVQLVNVAKVDGKISDTELELLHKEGRKFGLTDPEIDKLIKTGDPHHYNPPYSLREKFDELCEITEMILADDIVTNNEIRLMKKYGIAAGFTDHAIDKIIPFLLEGIKKGEDEDKLFHEFKKRHFK